MWAKAQVQDKQIFGLFFMQVLVLDSKKTS